MPLFSRIAVCRLLPDLTGIRQEKKERFYPGKNKYFCSYKGVLSMIPSLQFVKEHFE